MEDEPETGLQVQISSSRMSLIWVLHSVAPENGHAYDSKLIKTPENLDLNGPDASRLMVVTTSNCKSKHLVEHLVLRFAENC